MCGKKEPGSRFRDIKAFNFMTLAKEGWTILQSLDLLVARMLKATYFPHMYYISGLLTRIKSLVMFLAFNT